MKFLVKRKIFCGFLSFYLFTLRYANPYCIRFYVLISFSWEHLLSSFYIFSLSEHLNYVIKVTCHSFTLPHTTKEQNDFRTDLPKLFILFWRLCVKFCVLTFWIQNENQRKFFSIMWQYRFARTITHFFKISPTYFHGVIKSKRSNNVHETKKNCNNLIHFDGFCILRMVKFNEVNWRRVKRCWDISASKNRIHRTTQHNPTEYRTIRQYTNQNMECAV